MNARSAVLADLLTLSALLIAVAVAMTVAPLGTQGDGLDDASNVVMEDTGDHGLDKELDGQRGAVFDGRVINFAALSNNIAQHGEVLRQLSVFSERSVHGGRPRWTAPDWRTRTQ